MRGFLEGKEGRDFGFWIVAGEWAVEGHEDSWDNGVEGTGSVVLDGSRGGRKADPSLIMRCSG